MKEEQKNKVWSTVATFSNFKEADQYRNTLLNKHAAVKVKRGGRAGEIYRVKIWDPPTKEKRKSIKSKRSQKDGNKKVRSRQK
jgi:hypothetical protein